MNSEKFKVIGLGEILWDIFPDNKQLGGAPTNFAYHASQLGADAQIISAIGKDKLGDEILQKLAQLKLSDEFIFINETKATGTVSITMDEQNQHQFTIEPEVAWDFIPHSKSLTKLAQHTDALCFGTLAQRHPVSQQTIYDFIKATPASTWRILDVNFRQNFYNREILKSALKLANVLKVNEEELWMVAQTIGFYAADENVALKILTNSYRQLQIVVLTKADKGCIVYSYEEQQEYQHSGYPTPIDFVDSVGAGDAFTAMFTIGLLKKQRLDTVIQQANQFAAKICSQRGAIA